MHEHYWLQFSTISSMIFEISEVFVIHALLEKKTIHVLIYRLRYLYFYVFFMFSL